MQIGGLVRSSLVDYPGCVSAAVFTYGCNFRCPYCHNPHLVVSPTGGPHLLDVGEVLGFLAKRRGLLGGVVVTGGEPTVQPDLLPFLQSLKNLGYRIKLDTNGSRPDVLKDAIHSGLVDYLAMDLKGPLPAYAAAVGLQVSTECIAESVRAIRESGIPHEFRTTAVHPLHTQEDLIATGKMAHGTSLFVLQRFVNGQLLDPTFSAVATPFDDVDLAAAQSVLISLGVNCTIR